MTEISTPLGAVDQRTAPLLDVGGVTIRALVVGDVTILYATIPAGQAEALHTHPDPETIYVISGAVQGLVIAPSGEQDWSSVSAGESWHAPSDLRHAWRNPHDEPAELLLMTTPNLGNWFLEAGRPIASERDVQWPPSEQTLGRIFEAATRHSLWLASPQENAQVGIPASA